VLDNLPVFVRAVRECEVQNTQRPKNVGNLRHTLKCMNVTAFDKEMSKPVAFTLKKEHF